MDENLKAWYKQPYTLEMVLFFAIIFQIFKAIVEHGYSKERNSSCFNLSSNGTTTNNLEAFFGTQ